MDRLMLGSYKVEEQIGEGSFGAIFVGYHSILGRKSALKILKGFESKAEMEWRLSYS